MSYAAASDAITMYTTQNPVTTFVIAAMITMFIGIALFIRGYSVRKTDALKSKDYVIAGMFFFTLSFVPITAALLALRFKSQITQYLAKR